MTSLDERTIEPEGKYHGTVRIQSYAPTLREILLLNERCNYTGEKKGFHCWRIPHYEAERRHAQGKVDYQYVCRRHMNQFIFDHCSWRIFKNYEK